MVNCGLERALPPVKAEEEHECFVGGDERGTVLVNNSEAFIRVG